MVAGNYHRSIVAASKAKGKTVRAAEVRAVRFHEGHRTTEGRFLGGKMAGSKVKRRPVPGPDEHINIYDLTIMDDAAVRARAENMLDRYPVLRRIYSADFLERLVPDRWNLDNHLVWLLTDTAGEFATCFWAEGSAAPPPPARVGALEVFRTQIPPDGPLRGTVGQDRPRTWPTVPLCGPSGGIW